MGVLIKLSFPEKGDTDHSMKKVKKKNIKILFVKHLCSIYQQNLNCKQGAVSYSPYRISYVHCARHYCDSEM